MLRVKSIFKHQPVRYLIVGVFNAVFDVMVLNICVILLHLTLFWATLIGFIFGNLIGYFLHSRWTFRLDGASHGLGKLPHFYLVAGISLVITEVTVNGLTDIGLYYNYSKLVAIVLTAIWAYLAMRFWIFRQKVESRS